MSHFPGKLLPPEQELSLVRAAVINTAGWIMGLQPQLRLGLCINHCGAFTALLCHVPLLILIYCADQVPKPICT